MSAVEHANILEMKCLWCNTRTTFERLQKSRRHALWRQYGQRNMTSAKGEHTAVLHDVHSAPTTGKVSAEDQCPRQCSQQALAISDSQPIPPSHPVPENWLRQTWLCTMSSLYRTPICYTQLLFSVSKKFDLLDHVHTIGHSFAQCNFISTCAKHKFLKFTPVTGQALKIQASHTNTFGATLLSARPTNIRERRLQRRTERRHECA